MGRCEAPTLKILKLETSLFGKVVLIKHNVCVYSASLFFGFFTSVEQLLNKRQKTKNKEAACSTIQGSLVGIKLSACKLL